MAFYNYKIMYEVIPREWRSEYEKRWKEEYDSEFEGTADYDGDLWVLAGDYIKHLQARVAQLEASPADPAPALSPAPAPAAEPVTEQEREVLRAMRGAGEEDVQGLEPCLPDDLVEAWLAWIDARAAKEPPGA